MIDENLLNKVFALLQKHKLTVATAESCTGGLIAHTITNISGSSEYFDRGIISYSNKSKMELLDVAEDLLIKHGAVSPEVAEEMVNNIRAKSKVDIGIATTGIAGPTGGTKNKPVGLIYIAVSTKEGTKVERFLFSGDRIQNKEDACNAALKMLIDVIENI